MRRLWVVAAVGAVAVAALFVGISQNQEICTVSYQNNHFLALEVDPADVDFGPVSLDDYARGYLERLHAQRVDVTANRPWFVTVEAGEPFWIRSPLYGQPHETTKPCEDLKLRTSDSNSIGDFTFRLTEYTGVELEPQAVAAGGGETGFYRWYMDFRVDLDLTRDQLPGLYYLIYLYTLFPLQ